MGNASNISNEKETTLNTKGTKVDT